MRISSFSVNVLMLLVVRNYNIGCSFAIRRDFLYRSHPLETTAFESIEAEVRTFGSNTNSKHFN